MKVVLQRVKHASCTVDGKLISEIKEGYLLLVGFKIDDQITNIQKIASKIKKLRVFSDSEGKMNLNIDAIGGEMLSISQFTLYADTDNGARPSFTASAKYNDAIELYKVFNDELRKLGLTVYEGIFGADMKIDLLNDGPVTILFEN